MFQKIIKWTSIALLSFIVFSMMVIPVTNTFKKNGEPIQDARMIAEQKVKSGIKCSPATNQNCFTLTPGQLQRIQKMQNGLSRKKDR
jgi:hypothetical protein